MPPLEPEFDITFDLATDSPAGKDPDEHSPTLRRYHQLLWSKPLRSGQVLTLSTLPRRHEAYLIHTDSKGSRTWFGSDAITRSYTHWTRPKALVSAIAALTDDQRARYLNPPYTIGSAMIWPVRSKDRPTINQARGMRSAIADRMDLTLECIRRHYAGQPGSPLAGVLVAYGDFFALFDGFREFIDFFHFQDLVTANYDSVRFYLPLDDFTRSGVPLTVDEYVTYREATLTLIERRERRMHLGCQPAISHRRAGNPASDERVNDTVKDGWAK